MPNQLDLLTDDQLEDFRGALGKNHCAEEDFELQVVADAPASQGIYPIAVSVTVRRKSTGAERTYSCGHGSTWPADFEVDLDHGFFANVST